MKCCHFGPIQVLPSKATAGNDLWLVVSYFSSHPPYIRVGGRPTNCRFKVSGRLPCLCWGWGVRGGAPSQRKPRSLGRPPTCAFESVRSAEGLCPRGFFRVPHELGDLGKD